MHGIFIGYMGSSWGTWGPCIPMEHVGVPESPWGAWNLPGGTWDLHVSHEVSMERMGVPGSPWNALGFHGTHGGPWISTGCTRPSWGTRAPCVPMDTRTPVSLWGSWGLHRAHGAGAQPGAVRSPQAVAHPGPIQMCGAAGQHLAGLWP